MLQGSGLFEYASFPVEDCKDYDKVKEAILNAYHLNAEGFRKKFRDYRPTEDDTGTRFVTKLRNYLNRWMGLEKVSNFEELQDLILREQFVNSCDAELTTFLKERKPSSIKEMGKLTDQCVEAHGGWHPGHSKGKNSNKKVPR